MYDIFYYYADGNITERVAAIKTQWPTVKFIQKTSTLPNLILEASKLSLTRMFWLIPIDVNIKDDIIDYKVPDWDQKYVHTSSSITGIYLVSKNNTSLDQVKSIDFDLFNRVYDIVFLSNNEPNADKNYKRLLSRFPNAKQVNGVDGIFNAHLEASKIVSTPFFWVVDADAVISPNFNFDYVVPKWDFDVVHIWQSKNPVTGSVYGYGGIKLIPTYLLGIVKQNAFVDITTSLSSKIKIINQVANTTDFAISDITAWRSAFRECAKLSSSSIARQVQKETTDRLNQWLTLNKTHSFGKQVYDGAVSGVNFAKSGLDIKLINNYKWLEDQFIRYQQAQQPLEIFQR
jgi:hypothetical protein